MTTILLSAGDQSGDAHAAALVRVLRERLPTARFVGLGGASMAAAGVEIVVDSGALAVGGLVEVATSLPRIRRTLHALVDAVRAAQPDLVVLVDSGGFNLPFARAVRKVSSARILYYVAPQVWAWRPRRVHNLAARTDRIAVILPFEKRFYAEYGIEVEYVGHPLLDAGDAVHRDPERRAEARATLRREIAVPPTAPLLGLFPGSRRNELARNLPLQLAAFEALRRRPDAPAELQAVVGLAPNLDATETRRLLADRPAVHLAQGLGANALDGVEVALLKPGTITVEAMLKTVPMVVTGKGHPVSVWWARRSLRVDWLSMPNLIAQRAIVPELLQEDAQPDRIAAELAPLFAGTARNHQLEALAQVLESLGGPGATQRTAALVEEMLETDRA